MEETADVSSAANLYQEEGAEFYPIRTVSAVTGVNSITLRAWERRYGLIKPRRTPKGHRLYTRHDIELINRIVKLLQQGIAISQVPAALQAPQHEPPEVAAGSPGEPWERYQQRMLDAVIRFDDEALELAYNDPLSLYPIDVVTDRLLLPLLVTLGTRWESQEGSIAEEHFFAVYMRNKLGARFHHRRQRTHGPRLLICCMPGELHETGMLLFGLSAIDRDFRVLLLGPDMPLHELPAVVKRAACQGVALSSSVDPPEGVLEEDLPRLVDAVDCPVFVGGKTSVAWRDVIERAGAVPLGLEIRPAIQAIQQRLSNFPSSA
jgi:DNA-binding transcriptional MerR regulator